MGGRDYESLKEFADEHITKPICSIFNMDACSDDEKAAINEIDAKSDEDLLQAANVIADLAKEANAEFEAYLERLNEEYEKEEAKHNEKIAKIKEDHKFRYVQQVFAKRGITNPVSMDDEDDDDMGGEL